MDAAGAARPSEGEEKHSEEATDEGSASAPPSPPSPAPAALPLAPYHYPPRLYQPEPEPYHFPFPKYTQEPYDMSQQYAPPDKREEELYNGIKRECEDPYSFVEEEAMCAMLGGAPPPLHQPPHQHMMHQHQMMLGQPKKRGRKKKIKDENGMVIKMDGALGADGAPRPVKERKKHDRFNGMSEEEVARRTLPDHLAENLDIIIIGINPGLFAAYKGHHYAGPGNHFWKCLYLSGLTREQMSADEDYKLLNFGIGFTNMVARATKGSADLTRREIKEGSAILLEKLQTFRPKVAVFNGKLIYEVFSGKKDFCFGKQPDTIAGTNTYMWVMPSSSARCAQLPRAADKVPYYAALKAFVDALNGLRAAPEHAELVFPDTTSRRPQDELEIRRLTQEPELTEDGAPPKKKRGRPKKVRAPGEPPPPRQPRAPRPPPGLDARLPGMDHDQPVKKKRGRPKKIRPEEQQFLMQQQTQFMHQQQQQQQPPPPPPEPAYPAEPAMMFPQEPPYYHQPEHHAGVGGVGGGGVMEGGLDMGGGFAPSPAPYAASPRNLYSPRQSGYVSSPGRAAYPGSPAQPPPHQYPGSPAPPPPHQQYPASPAPFAAGSPNAGAQYASPHATTSPRYQRDYHHYEPRELQQPPPPPPQQQQQQSTPRSYSVSPRPASPAGAGTPAPPAAPAAPYSASPAYSAHSPALYDQTPKHHYQQQATGGVSLCGDLGAMSPGACASPHLEFEPPKPRLDDDYKSAPGSSEMSPAHAPAAAGLFEPEPRRAPYRLHPAHPAHPAPDRYAPDPVGSPRLEQHQLHQHSGLYANSYPRSNSVGSVGGSPYSPHAVAFRPPEQQHAPPASPSAAGAAGAPGASYSKADVAAKSLSGLESLVDQIPSIGEAEPPPLDYPLYGYGYGAPLVGYGGGWARPYLPDWQYGYGTYAPYNSYYAPPPPQPYLLELHKADPAAPAQPPPAPPVFGSYC